MLCLQKAEPKGCIDGAKIMGPMMEPCGTPQVIGTNFDREGLSLKEVNCVNRVPEMI